MEQSTLNQRIRFDEPWNSPANSALFGTMSAPYPYQCPSHESNSTGTHYFAVVGEHTAWPHGRGRTKAELQDELSSTILVVEAPHKRVHWAAPADMTFDEAVKYLTEVPVERSYLHQVDHGFFRKPGWMINVAFADGSVRQVALPLPRDVAVALLTVDGGEQIDEAQLDELGKSELDYANIYAFAAFVVLAVLPGFRLIGRRRSGLAQSVGGAPASY
jgi:prepilin-type processing-associated H-X9-DG protein